MRKLTLMPMRLVKYYDMLQISPSRFAIRFHNYK
jgi:hypothetical protein